METQILNVDAVAEKLWDEGWQTVFTFVSGYWEARVMRRKSAPLPGYRLAQPVFAFKADFQSDALAKCVKRIAEATK